MEPKQRKEASCLGNRKTRTNPKKFIPKTKPRYLLGQVEHMRMFTDLVAYNAHRKRVHYATPLVDTTAPRLNPAYYLDLNTLKQNHEKLRAIERENRQLLAKIVKINMFGGIVDSFNPLAYKRTTALKRRERERQYRKIEVRNKAIYNLITKAESLYSNKKVMQPHWIKVLKQLNEQTRFKLTILDKPDPDDILRSSPSISQHLDKIFLSMPDQRPYCFMEFREKTGRYVGRILIRLYHDYAPVTVQNFLELCKGTYFGLSYKNCRIHRIVPGKFMATGDITKGSGRGGYSIYGSAFDEEKHLLKHTKPGVLSMIRDKKGRNNSQFAITFCRMDCLDSLNVVFGCITKGMKTLTAISNYGRKIGKPEAELIISNCGVYNSNEKSDKSSTNSSKMQKKFQKRASDSFEFESDRTIESVTLCSPCVS